MKTRIVAIAVASLFVTAACSGNHKEKVKKSSPAPAEKNALIEAFSVFGNKFDPKDQTVSKNILGASADVKFENVSGDGAINTNWKLTFQVFFKGTTNAVELYSESMDPKSFRSGEPIELTYEMNKEDLAKYAGGTLAGKARCLDTSCSRVGLLLEVHSGSQDLGRVPKLAGIIFANTPSIGYRVETSNSGKLPSVEEAQAAKM